MADRPRHDDRRGRPAPGRPSGKPGQTGFPGGGGPPRPMSSRSEHSGQGARGVGSHPPGDRPWDSRPSGSFWSGPRPVGPRPVGPRPVDSRPSAHAPSAHAPSAHAPSIRGRPPGRTGSGLPPARRPGHTAGISRMAQVGRRPGTVWHLSVDRGIRTQPCRDTQAATVAATSAHMARRRDVRTTDVRTTAARRPSTSVDPTVPAIVRRGPPHQGAVPVSARRIGAVHRPIARPGDLRKARSNPRGPAGGRAPGRNHRPGRDQTR